MRISEHQVVIAGGGPTGMMLAAELALGGVDVAIVERRVDQSVEGSRASGLHPRAIELLDQRGVAGRFIAEGTRHHAVIFAGTILDAADRPTRHNYTLGLWQAKIERGLAEWIAGLPVTQYRGRAVTGFAEDAGGIDIALDDGGVLRAGYLAGCDGGRSLVRKAADISFPGWDPDISYLIYEASMAQAPVLGIQHGARGIHAMGKLDDGDGPVDGRFRGVVTEARLERGDRPDEAALRAALAAAYGSDFGVHDVTWLSRFTDAARQADAYRKGRVLLAGDAAHVHSPVGGQGLNIGLQDAVNLGWKLAQVAKGVSPAALLDSYHAERHPVGAALLQHTLALTALNRGDPRTSALRAMMAGVMQQEGPRKWFAALMSGLDIRYDMGGDEDAHPLLGRRMPDLDIETAEGPTRIFALMHDARPVLLNLGAPGALPIGGWADRVKTVDARFEGVCALPVIGMVATPAAVLIRPDGHVAWVGDGGSDGLAGGLERWFGGG